MSNNSNKDRQPPQGFIHSDITYGHVHMAKTAGTEINGMLASRFERVCGHKGNSYDLYQSQLRRQEKTAEERSDSIAKLYPKYHRARVPQPILKEVGYEDCDYISQEEKWTVWPDIMDNFKMEIHVPCRDPIQHLMSQCHSKGATFDCDAAMNKNLKAEVEKCFVFINRFSQELRTNNNNSSSTSTTTTTTFKCFDPIPLERYMDYMSTKLQPRKKPFDYIRVSKPRNKETECIWDHPKLLERVKNVLLKTDYYQFCDECTGSENDLYYDYDNTHDDALM
eukprot:CAMPEP_0194044652 /NCGR_PEP_ID=MMETSP0009_2-20130614/16090_1 /TAXON_ID=210454 /ORGANISM="Grammatophora oceanica, Strain CCMP 410" /LENGTH=279 /DNA_ID=CAMNT_0038689229 /DNA_START=141 /DNA_END=980 /DNA_ORIENTATION=+